MHFPFPLRLKWRSMAVAMVAALMMAVLTVGSVLAQGHVANDGQTLAMQSPEVQALFTSAHGDDAAAQWVNEHNAAIGPAQPATPAVGASADYFRVRHVAYMRSGDLDMADRITADVIARGTVDQFLAGMDMGVIYGYVVPAPQPRAAPSSSSSSTSSGPSAPKSPSTSTVTGWGNITRNYEVGQTVSLTLPDSSHAGVNGYVLTEKGSKLNDVGLMFVAAKRQVTGTLTEKDKPLPFKFVGDYSAQVDGEDIEAPFILTLTINVRDADLQPRFRDDASIDPMEFLEDEIVNVTKGLPTVLSGNEPIMYSASGRPKGIGFDNKNRKLTGAPTALGSHQITYTAEDQDGDTASLTFTITVEADTKPVAPSIGSMTFTEGEAIAGRFLPMGSGGNGDLSYKLSGQPTKLSFNPETRWLSGTLEMLEPGISSETYTVTYTVEDSKGKLKMSTTTFTITVEAAD